MCENTNPNSEVASGGLEADGSMMHDFLGRILMMQAGSLTVIEWAINVVQKGGNVVLIGVYGPPWNLVPIGTAMNKGLTLRMAQCNTKRYMPHLLEHIREGRVDAKGLISHRFALDEIPEAYKMFAGKQDGCRKVVLTP